MNLRIRLKNPVCIIQLILAIIMPVYAYFGLKGEDISTWGKLLSVMADGFKNPYIVMTVLISVWNTLTDPTTKGGDSKEALGYICPKG